MTCYRSRDNWHSYVKRSLTESALEGLSAHLTHCPECREHVADIEETASLLAKNRVSLTPPASIKFNVMLSIDKSKYKKVSSSHLFELKNWGFSMVAGGLILLALNFSSLAPNFESGQVAELNHQISRQLEHPFDKVSEAAYAAFIKIETITRSPEK